MVLHGEVSPENTLRKVMNTFSGCCHSVSCISTRAVSTGHRTALTAFSVSVTLFHESTSSVSAGGKTGAQKHDVCFPVQGLLANKDTHRPRVLR
jgi:hypothetical protein